MPKPAQRAPKRPSSPRKTSKKVKGPASRTRRGRTALKAPTAVKVSLAERRGLTLAALERAQALLWAAAKVTSATVGGVEVRVAALGSIWALRTHGLAAAAGLEVALRLPRLKDEAHPPAWAFSVLERLIGLAREDGLSSGQVVRWPTPFGEGAQTDLEAFAIAVDLSFGEVKTEHDVVPVLLAVGITGDEVRLLREWSPEGLLEVLSKLDPTWSTALDRASLLASPRARQAIEQRVEREGSSMGVLQARVSKGAGKGRLVWTVDAETADAIVSLLKGRIGHQRPFLVRGGDFELELQPGDAPALSVEGARATLKLTQAMARNLRATLKARPGSYTWEGLPTLFVEVVP